MEKLHQKVSPKKGPLGIVVFTAIFCLSLGVLAFMFVPAAYAGVPTYSSGGPINGQNYVPIYPLIDIMASEALIPGTVSSADITLYSCTGATDASACATPVTTTNLCAVATVDAANTKISCTLGAPLSINTTYKFTVGTVAHSASTNQGAAASTIRIFRTGAIDPNSDNTPPVIQMTTPGPGSQSFPTNGNIVVQFSSVMTSASSDNSVTVAQNVILKTLVGGLPTGNNICAGGGCALTFSGTTKSLTIDPTANLTASTDYALTIKKNVTNTTSIALSASNDFVLYFRTGSTTDTSAPTFTTTPTTVRTGTPPTVSANVADFTVQFSKAMDPATFSVSTIIWFKDNGAGGGTANNFLKEANEPALSPDDINFNYSSSEKAIHFGFKNALAAATTYCVKLIGGSSGIKDAYGNAMAAATVNCFTTGSAVTDSTPPTVLYADADNYGIWLQFSEPVNSGAATTDASVLNSANYTVQNPVGATVSLANATLTYRPEASGLEITGIGLQTSQQFQVEVVNVKDRADNAIVDNNTTNIAAGMVQNATTTGGYRGGYTVPDFTSNTNFGTFWAQPKRCNPRSPVASQSTKIECEFPSPAALATGATIILTMPSGFDISGVTAPAASVSYMNADLNGPQGAGTTTISSVAGNSGTNTITVTLAHSGTAMGSNDQLRFELANIINPSTAGEKTVSGIVKDASGVKQGETMYFAPFNIGSAGSLSISGKVCKGTASGGTCGESDTAIAGMTVFLDSFGSFGSGGSMGGHQEATSDASGNFTFTGLYAGQYGLNLLLDSAVVSNIGGGTNSQSITLTDSNKTSADFHLVDLSSTGKTLTVTITNGPASTDMDIYCSAPGNYQFSAPITKKVTTNGSGAASGTLKLQPNTTYECGIRPYIPPSSMASGGPMAVPTFTFMPPPPQTVNVLSADVAASFSLMVATSQVLGKVIDGSSVGIANVFVNAMPLSCFNTTTGANMNCQGGYAQTKSDGNFVLPITHGTYQISACSPGMPCSSPVEVTVKANSAEEDSNSAADVYQNGTLLTGTGLSIKLAKTSVTISGQVLDENSSAIKYAFVDAQKVTSGDTCASFTSTGGGAGSPTDASGNYTLYVGNGTWRVSGHAQSYGDVACSIITVSSGTSLTGQNLQATASNYGTISGTVAKNSVAVGGAQVNCYGVSGSNQAVSGVDGSYSMKLKAGTGYTCEGFLPGAGPLTPATSQTVTASSTTTVNLAIGNPGTITVDLGSTITDAFCDARASNGRGMGTGQNNNGVYTLNVPAGTYTVSCNNPKYGRIGAETVVLAAGGTSAVDLTASAPTLYTVSGRVTDGSNNLNGATVTMTDDISGRIVVASSSAATADNNVSISMPAGTYTIMASKSGYVDSSAAQTLTISANASFTTRALTRAQAAVAITVTQSGSNYSGNGRVIATDTSYRIVTAEIDKTITSGANAALTLTNGTWSVRAFVDNGKTVASATTITVASNTASPSSATLAVDTAISGFTASGTKQQSLTPNAGGIFRDTNIGSNFEVNIPSSVLSNSDSSSGSIETKYDPSLAINTPGKKFIGSAAISITPKDANGNALDEFSSEAQGVTLKIPYTDADVTAAGVDESKLVVGAWNEASQEWETLPTIVDTTNNFLTAQTTHFSSFAPIAPEAGAPDTPTGLAATAVAYNQINLAWTAASGATGYDIYRDTSLTGLFSRIGSEPTISSGSTVAYSDTSALASTLYYYKITSINASGESAASSAVSATTPAQPGGGGGGATVYPSAKAGTGVLGFTINNNQATTASPDLQIAFNADPTTVNGYFISLNQSFVGATSRSYTSTTAAASFSLPAVAGTYTVYLKYYSTTGTYSSVLSKTITYQPSAVTAPSLTDNIAPAPAPSTSADTGANITPSNAGVSTNVGQQAKYQFKRVLKVGDKGEDVKQLQIFLNTHGFVIAATGAGSLGKETTLFGALTKIALAKYQESQASKILTPLGLIKGTGTLGASTMKLINSAGQSATAPTPSPAAVANANSNAAFKRVLKPGDKGEDVKQLQVFLNTHGYIITLAGPGSPGQETTLFGSLTKQALITYQEAHAEQILKPVGLTKGTGTFGASTMKFMNKSVQ